MAMVSTHRPHRSQLEARVEGAYLDRTDQGFKPLFLKTEPSTELVCARILTQCPDKCVFLIQNIPTDMLSKVLGLFLLC